MIESTGQVKIIRVGCGILVSQAKPLSPKLTECVGVISVVYRGKLFFSILVKYSCRLLSSFLHTSVSQHFQTIFHFASERVLNIPVFFSNPRTLLIILEELNSRAVSKNSNEFYFTNNEYLRMWTQFLHILAFSEKYLSV